MNTGDRRQKTGDRRQGTEDRRQQTAVEAQAPRHGPGAAGAKGGEREAVGGRERVRSAAGTAALWLLMGLAVARAQNFSIDWFKVSGGGGTSTNGQFALSGTIGQQDAGGPMFGGTFSLTSGFWSLIAAVQTPGAPSLTIFGTSTNTVIVRWAFPSTGFVLQQNTNVAATNWVAGPTPTNDGVNNFVIVTPSPGNLFFRLVNP